jgi:DNA helicase II / ATP-dependent DNA helicase PcrA
MTRAEKRLVLSWAKLRRRFGGGEQERTLPSRFLKEIPSNLVMQLGAQDDDDVPQVDLTAERWQVRQESRRNLYTGKTYNSVENVAQFFKERGVNIPLRPVAAPAAPPVSRPAPPAARPPISTPRPPAAPATPAQRGLFGNSPAISRPAPPRNIIPPARTSKPLPKAPPASSQPARTGTVVEHPTYGTGTIVRREGEGDNAKVVVIFQRHGIKKLVEKYAGLKKS